MRSIRMTTAVMTACAAMAFAGATAHADDETTDDTEETDEVAEAPAAVDSSSVTLPLFGAPLTVDVTTDAGGGLVEVALNPTDDYTATGVKPNRVRFVSEDGSATVRVSAKKGGERIGVTAGTLDDVSGPGSWSGDVFGDGSTTTVSFSVGAADDGSPSISDVAVDSTASFEIGDVEAKTSDDGSRTGSRASVAFSQAGQTRSLTISVGVRSGDDAASSIRIKLSRLRGRQIVEGDTVGSHTWTGVLCDGSQASISYVVGDDGSITDIVASPEAEIQDGRQVRVRFSQRELVSIKLTDRDDTSTLTATPRIRCDRTDPTVNTPVDETADETTEAERAERAERREERRDERDDQRGERKRERGG